MVILLPKMRHFRSPGQFKSQDGGEGGGGEAIGCQRNGAENINADSFLPLFSLTQLKDNPYCSAVILGLPFQTILFLGGQFWVLGVLRGQKFEIFKLDQF